jgi:putative ABC transport system substrate-binding protein
MKRREFITLLGGAAAWPLAARAQKGETTRRIAVLMGTAATGQGETYLASFLQRLEELRWLQGRNISTNVRWWADGPEQMRTAVAEQLAFSPDVFVVWSNLALELLKPMAGKVPIVFAGVGDPAPRAGRPASTRSVGASSAPCAACSGRGSRGATCSPPSVWRP